MPLICPTCQILFRVIGKFAENVEAPARCAEPVTAALAVDRAVNATAKIQPNRFDNLKLYLWIALPPTKIPLPVSRRGLYDIGDDIDVPLICPTRQAQKILGTPTFKRKAFAKPWGLERQPTTLQIARRP